MSTQQQTKKGGAAGWIITGVILVGIVLAIIAGEGGFDSSDNDTSVPPPTAQETADLAARLAEAEKAHGICYGWELSRSTYSTRPEDVVSMGSSRGAGVSARECDDWVILQVGVEYTSASSESEDSAAIDVDSSDSLTGKHPYSGDLERMGVTRDAALNDPAATTGLGVLSLPLLMVEEGAAHALPATPADAAQPTPIGRPGSDFVGNHTGALIALGIIGGIALLCLIIGLIIRKRGKEAR
ncbi:hypothetical protein [Actinokineospora fastidiosa]|uniref:Uncharacterized protein n=1 Tax=Actinokineospora fastidiosa TaxID=1816 RepID=A0A918G3C2_9PSEU|nr:hypothetical protein [Actinokineospora fastidiosa]GGS16270.1 hypothetical protein GCM10010171_05560 [Actinokineospora fastidiosa]